MSSYRLIVSSSPFRQTYIHPNIYKSFIVAWLISLMLVIQNQFAIIEIQILESKSK